MSFTYGEAGREREEKMKKQDKKTIKKRTSYKKWKNIQTRLKKCKTDVDRLRLIYHVVDEHKGFQYAWLSTSAKQTIELIIKEEKQKED